MQNFKNSRRADDDHCGHAKRARPDDYEHGQSPVLHFRNLVPGLIEANLIDAVRHFGYVSYVKLLDREQALVEFETVESAMKCISAKKPIFVAESAATVSYANSQFIGRSPIESRIPKRSLVITVKNVIHPWIIDMDVIKQMCSLCGKATRITVNKTVKQEGEVQAMVEFENVGMASQAKRSFNGSDVYQNACPMKVEFYKDDSIPIPGILDVYWMLELNGFNDQQNLMKTVEAVSGSANGRWTCISSSTEKAVDREAVKDSSFARTAVRKSYEGGISEPKFSGNNGFSSRGFSANGGTNSSIKGSPHQSFNTSFSDAGSNLSNNKGSPIVKGYGKKKYGANNNLEEKTVELSTNPLTTSSKQEFGNVNEFSSRGFSANGGTSCLIKESPQQSFNRFANAGSNLSNKGSPVVRGYGKNFGTNINLESKNLGLNTNPLAVSSKQESGQVNGFSSRGFSANGGINSSLKESPQQSFNRFANAGSNLANKGSPAVKGYVKKKYGTNNNNLESKPLETLGLNIIPSATSSKQEFGSVNEFSSRGFSANGGTSSSIKESTQLPFNGSFAGAGSNLSGKVSPVVKGYGKKKYGVNNNVEPKSHEIPGLIVNSSATLSKHTAT